MTDKTELDRLSAAATQGEWEIQDGNSWRRIGTSGHDGDVLCPATYSTTDSHPDLTARDGNLYPNLRFVVALVNAYRAGEIVHASTVADLEAERDALREHIAEQITHVEKRIRDGVQSGAVVWRIALEDVACENRTALDRGQ